MVEGDSIRSILQEAAMQELMVLLSPQAAERAARSIAEKQEKQVVEFISKRLLSVKAAGDTGNAEGGAKGSEPKKRRGRPPKR